MKNCSKILILLVFGVLWDFGSFSSQKDLASCSFFYWRVDWHSAAEACRREDKRLLCYKGRKEVDDITEAFRLSSIHNDAELDIWMANKNCSSNSEVECLSLHITKSGKRVWHFFQEDCERAFPFVCCVKESELTSTASTASEASTSTEDASSTASLSSSTAAKPKTCPPVRRRGIYWPETRVGETANHSCPGNSTGNVFWSCQEIHGHARWFERGPNFRECRSDNIGILKDKFNTSSLAEIMTLLENTFRPTTGGVEMFGEDLAQVVALLTALPQKLYSGTSHLPGPERWAATWDYVAQSAAIFDRMMDLDDSWMDMEDQRRSAAGTEFLSTVDEMGLLLADAMADGVDQQSILTTNMALQVTRAPTPGQSLQLPLGGSSDGVSHGGSILLEGGFDSGLSGGNVSVVFTLYSDLRSILRSDHNSSSHPGELNSAVVSAIVAQNREPAEIKGTVRILVEHLTSQPNQTACVFWNVQQNLWDTYGCQLESSNLSHSLCVCDHLTNFAVLMDYQGVLDDVDQTFFNYITLVGCSLSVICLTFCVIIFSCYSYHSKHSWGVRYVIHRNLCLTLLIANLFLIFGLDETENSSLCAAVAGALHYFFLSAFSWMLLEGVHIYLLLVVVFASRRSHWEKYYLFGYGFPMIIVTITAIARPTYYGTEEACWLSTEKGTIWAFMGPVALILILNSAALLLAQWKASKVSGKDDNSAMFKRWLRVTFILFPVLGITWIFGFLYVGSHFQVAGYLFAAFNSLQGFCIFVCHCLMDKKARNMVISSIRKKTASVSTGSSTAQKNKQKGSSNGTSIQNATQQVEKKGLSFAEVCRRHWHRWPRPWSFCFDLPVSESGSFEVPKEHGELPVQWHSMQDKAA